MAAEALLRQAFVTLEPEHVLPRPRHASWLRMACDYCGHMRASDQELVAAVDATYPDRFRRWRWGDGFDVPYGYGSALVEGEVAAATRAEGPYDVTSPSVRRVLDEFIQTVANPRHVVVAEVVTDVEVSDRGSVTIDRSTDGSTSSRRLKALSAT